MDIELSFPGGKRVVAQVGAHRIETDQPPELGGQGAAPAPFELFLASIATCAGVYALGFLQARALPTEGLRVRQLVELDPATHTPRNIRLELTLPAGVPEKYRIAVVRAVESCKVKKTIAAMPSFEVVLQEQAQVAHVQSDL
jgi:ribosomal protein S12 methylthiotransferase accessory factor